MHANMRDPAQHNRPQSGFLRWCKDRCATAVGLIKAARRPTQLTSGIRQLTPGFQSELDYWDTELSLKGTYPEAILDRTQPERMANCYPAYISPFIEEAAKRRGRAPKVLDVGSGPLSMFVYGSEKGLFELTCADPLAGEYEALLTKYGYPHRSRLVQCRGEALSKVFGLDAFDLVWIHNALDHSQSPRDVFVEMARVLAPGGYLIVQSWAKEGRNEGYIGLHQHDLYLGAPGQLMCETRGAEQQGACCLNEGLTLELIESASEFTGEREWIRLIYRKPLRNPA
jgi:SAM-dependent methyltransferase